MRAMVVALLSMLIAGSHSYGTPDADNWLSYEPSTVELKGTLRIVPEFGPPNFGEQPKTDLRVLIPMLDLDAPINIRADPNSDMNYQSFKGIRRLQLAFPAGAPSNKKLVDREIVVSGSLFQAFTANHYTKVLLAVEKIRSATPEHHPGKKTPQPSASTATIGAPRPVEQCNGARSVF